MTGEGPCFHEHTIPEECRGNDCDYRLTMRYLADDNSFDVSLTARVMPDTWTGVGFSETGSMVGSDAVLVWLDGTTGRVMVRDYQLNSKSASGVVADASQDVTVDMDNTNYNDGVLRASFNRRRDTGDNADFVFGDSDNGCAMLLLPNPGDGAGPVQGGQVGYHPRTPLVRRKTCIKACSAGNRVAPPIVTLILAAVGAALTLLINTHF